MNKMNDPSKKFVLFHDNTMPSLKLMKKRALKEEDFDGYTYSHDRNEDIEVWTKQ